MSLNKEIEAELSFVAWPKKSHSIISAVLYQWRKSQRSTQIKGEDT